MYPIEVEEPFRFDADMEILPFGLHDGSQWANKVFQMAPEPLSFTEEDLKKISNQIWKKPEHQQSFSFENPEHLLALYKSYKDIKFEADQDPEQIYCAAASLLRTLHFYEENAKLNDL